MPSIDDVWRTRAGAHLFNGISRMDLVRRDGSDARLSDGVRLAKETIGLLLEAGYVPKDMTQLIARENHDGK